VDSYKEMFADELKQLKKNAKKIAKEVIEVIPEPKKEKKPLVA
jgi:hypothetical protein